MKNKIRKITTYAALRNDTLDLLKLMADYKDDTELLSWLKQRIDFNVDRMLRILKNGEE